MKQSFLFTKTTKNLPKEEQSINAGLLIKAGFVDKLAAGIYSYLPLGLLVLKKIENIIRREMNEIGGQEILMPALTPKENWQKTNRWQGFDALFKLEGGGKEYALGATHEEIISPLAKNFVFSYKDLPCYIYQIQTKFRNEPRAKSGLIRGREFLMKDLYSFHADGKDLDEYYEKVKAAYFKIFNKCGLGEKTYLTLASGGSFSKYSHEFQTISEAGEDTIFICSKCKIAINKEIKEENSFCPECKNKVFEEKKAIEVGNIFKLKTKYSEPFNFKYKDKNGHEKLVEMGCYGIGPSRVLATAVEISHDNNGIIWPKNIAPFQAHLISLSSEKKETEQIYYSLQKRGVEVLFDDREEAPGFKLKDADLLGMPIRLVLGPKSKNKIEFKFRNQPAVKLLTLSQTAAEIEKFYKK